MPTSEEKQTKSTTYGLHPLKFGGLAVALASCAVRPKTVYHSFSFDGWFDKWAPDADLLAYDYGNVHPMVNNAAGKLYEYLGYRLGIHSAMPVGEYLYVKWRIKSTGEVLEDKVDLRPLLPANMFEHGLTFVIDGRQLYVYVVTPKTKDKNAPPILKTTESRYHVTYEIYPHNTFKP